MKATLPILLSLAATAATAHAQTGIADAGTDWTPVIAVVGIVIIIGIIVFVLDQAADSRKRAAMAHRYDDFDRFVSDILAKGRLNPIHTPVLLDGSEKAYYSQPSNLSEVQDTTKYRSGFAGLRLAMGIYVGGSRGESIRVQEWQQIDEGTLVCTGGRIIFDGRITNRSVFLEKILSVKQISDTEIEISEDGRQHNMILSSPNPPILCAIIHALRDPAFDWKEAAAAVNEWRASHRAS